MFNPLTSLSNVLPILSDGAPRNYRGCFHSSLLISLRNVFSGWGRISSHPNWHQSRTLGTLPNCYKSSAWSTQTDEIMGISNEPQEVSVSEPIPLCLGPLREIHAFLLSSSTPIHLFIQDFLETYHARISYSQKGEIILEIDSSHQSNKPGELNDPLASFSVLALMALELILETLFIPTESANTFITGKSSNWCAKFTMRPPIRIQAGLSKPLPRINQYPIRGPWRHKAHNRTLPSTRPQYSCASPCTTPILLVRKPKGRGWRFAQDLHTINNTVKSSTPGYS